MGLDKSVKTSSAGIMSNASIVQPHTMSQSIAEMSENGQSFVMSLTSEG